MLGLNKVQKEYKSDVLAFGRYIHIHHRNEWYSGIKDKWERLFPDVPISIKSSVDIHYSSTYQIPMNVEKQKGSN